VEEFPTQIISNNGKEFKNKLMEYIKNQFHIKHIFLKFYHSVGFIIIERKVQTAKQLFIKLQNVTEQQFNDDEILELIQYLMNNRKIASIETIYFKDVNSIHRFLAKEGKMNMKNLKIFS
jgi:predicted nucleotidyltransferase